MAVIGTFGSFSTARLGIYASQASLQVTGNNIANINTKGYTRQRADLYSLNSTGTAKYANPMGVDIGYGVLVKSTTQIRDPYLDIRFRNQNTKTAYADTMLSGLRKIAQTLDEVNKGGVTQNGVIENALQNMKTMLEDLSDNVGSEEHDGLVREAAKSLTSFFNTAAEKLQKDWDLQADELHDTITEVNKCLINIRDLNEQIRKQGLYGDLALELRDARNLYIDELSGYMGINVEYSMERIDQYTEVEKLTITLSDTKDPKTGDPIKLIDGLFGAQISLSDVEVNPFYSPKGEIYALTNGTAGSYVDRYGNVTRNIRDAAIYRQNPAYDPNDGGKTLPYLDPDGKPTATLPAGAELVSDKKYLTAAGVPTDNLDENAADAAGKVDPNRFLLQVERLEDKFGRPLDRNKNTESVPVPLTDTDLNGTLQAMRELLTESGEFATKKEVGTDGNMSYSDIRAMDPDAAIKKGIPYYQQQLDLLAQKLAQIFNEANQLPASTVYVNDGANFKDNADPAVAQNIIGPDGNAIELDDVTVTINGVRVPIMDTKEVRDALANQHGLDEEGVDEYIANSAKCLEILRDQGVIDKAYGHYDGGVLFSNNGNNNDPSNITASNISIAHSWASRIVRVLNRTQPNEVSNDGKIIDHSSDNDNILHIISLFEKQLDYAADELEPDAAGGSKIYFHGSFQEMYTYIGATLGSEGSTIAGISSNYDLMTLDMDNDRISISGVDLNDEATNMMQFQKSYQAACRLMTTIDSVLDTLINNTLR